ncbi:MAG TPA: hypothetical protein VEL07_16600 [Planctomycetota bacterium]|nr:hypothetical protein [Planctomycetota bacterium]
MTPAPSARDRDHELVAIALATLRADRATGADYRPDDLPLITAWRSCADTLPRVAPLARSALAAWLADHVGDLNDLIDRARRGCGPTPFLDEVERTLATYA